MNKETQFTAKILVPLAEQTVARLMARQKNGESLADIIDRISLSPGCERPKDTAPAAKRRRGKYTGMLRGEPIHADTLGELYAQFIDKVHELDPAAIERLAGGESPTGSRRYVARSRDDVHPGKPHLSDRTVKARSGWWVSTNVSRETAEKNLRVLAEVAGLSWERDILFPA